MTAVLRGINADLDELSAVGQVAQARQTLADAQARERQAEAAVSTSAAHLARLALAAYTGEAPPNTGAGAATAAERMLNVMAEGVQVAIKGDTAMLQSDRQDVNEATGTLALAKTKVVSADPAAQSPAILGHSVLSAAEMAAWFASTGHVARTTVPVAQLASDYLAAGAQTGVRGDIAFAQSVIETDYFAFPGVGQHMAVQNNFAGIGACDSCATGRSFPNAQTGVTAQEELLAAYASSHPVPTPLIGSVGVGGCCPTWMALAGKWATNPEYGLSIMQVYRQMLDFAVSDRLAAAGLNPAARRSAPAA
ncbi:MAG: glucosaminidase domain-containing protein [Acidimicrobiaceae bacterium]|nr:glucosaminidase domain-containing protein [Acidimicrobiaceae bacterium]